MSESRMPTQDDLWSKAAAAYEKEFIDPYLPDVRDNPLTQLLPRLGDPDQSVVADLGCGIGPLLPLLSQSFRKVYALDFAAGMLARARAQVLPRNNVTFMQADLAELPGFAEPWDVAVAVNSLVMPDVRAQEKVLHGIHARLKPGGYFLGIVPAMDAIHYFTMLLLDRALASGKPMDVARKNAAHHGDHSMYDFAFGQARYDGLEQHFWQPFEVHYRFRRAGFRVRRLKKVYLSWHQFAADKSLHQLTPPWDWFFLARKPGTIDGEATQCKS
jgi:SAM-dependent methyltransferase